MHETKGLTLTNDSLVLIGLGLGLGLGLVIFVPYTVTLNNFLEKAISHPQQDAASSLTNAQVSIFFLFSPGFHTFWGEMFTT